jgi:hypothetical protein
MASLHDRSVQAARRERLAKEISAITQLSLASVRGRLARAHGRKLLRNLFADVWPKSLSAPAAKPNPLPKGTPKPIRTGTAQSPERTVHRVRQEFETSCGVAVVAMCARVSHKQAMAVLFPKPTLVFFTWPEQVKRALDHFGVKHGKRWHRFASWDEIPTTSLVKVKWEDADGGHGLHWVVFQRRADGGWTVIDPDRQNRGRSQSRTQRLSRREREQLTGVTYLPVEARPPGAG